MRALVPCQFSTVVMNFQQNKKHKGHIEGGAIKEKNDLFEKRVTKIHTSCRFLM